VREEVSVQAAKVFDSLADALETGSVATRTVVLTTVGSELGAQELVRGAELAVDKDPSLKVILVGPQVETLLPVMEVSCEKDAHARMEELLASGQAHAAVTLHYNFPLGVSIVGRIVTPARGTPVLLATTTGTTAVDRVEAMVKNTLNGVAVAKALGIQHPKVGILNLEGARRVERILQTLQQQGYGLEFSESVRSDGGCILRGNDLLVGSADVVVCDTLTGNFLMKLFSAFTSGGEYETLGWGYGPGAGANFDKVINIISRASGAPVVASAIEYAARASQGDLPQLAAQEYQAAEKAGLEQLLNKTEPAAPTTDNIPPKQPVTQEISGIDILEMDEAACSLWAAGIYAETGMGCTGPVIMVPEGLDLKARSILSEHGWI